MSLFAIGDLHLSLNERKPMEIFGSEWRNHHIKIRENWEKIVKPSDTVIITGDISWALKLKDALADLRFIDEMPGNKILVKGNHDYWWDSVKKNREAFPRLNFLQNNYFAYGNYGICGTRGWTCPGEDERYALKSKAGDIQEDSMKIYKRELNRLELSYAAAHKNGIDKFICAMHFPPVNSNKERSDFIDIIEKYNTVKVVFGHLHGVEGFAAGDIKGFGECRYILTSCDYLDFTPKELLLY